LTTDSRIAASAAASTSVATFCAYADSASSSPSPLVRAESTATSLGLANRSDESGADAAKTFSRRDPSEGASGDAPLVLGASSLFPLSTTSSLGAFAAFSGSGLEAQHPIASAAARRARAPEGMQRGRPFLQLFRCALLPAKFRRGGVRCIRTFFTHTSVSIFDRFTFQLTDEHRLLNAPEVC
jgi:hypothetical protein